jgi:hypothetical protein
MLLQQTEGAFAMSTDAIIFVSASVILFAVFAFTLAIVNHRTS